MVTSTEFDTSVGHHTETMGRLINLVKFCIRADYAGQLQRLLRKFTEDFRRAPVEKRSEKLDFMCRVLQEWHNTPGCWSSDQNSHFVDIYCLAAEALLDQDLPTFEASIDTLVIVVSRSGLLEKLVSRLVPHHCIL
jgi:hypothetical protein